VRTETDWASIRPTGLRFTRHYLSTWGLDGSTHFSTLGKAWRHSHDITLSQQTTAGGATVRILTGEGYERSFTRAADTSAWVPVGHNDSLSLDAAGQWIYRRADQDDTLVFGPSGQLLTRTARNGWQTAYAYDAQQRLSTVTDPLGQTLALAYDSAGQLASVTAPAGHVTTYGYDSANRLTQVTYPDGTARHFLYENASYPYALTGIQDANGNRWGSFAYDAQGRAVSTELAGGVQRYQASYPSDGIGAVSIIDPLGITRSFAYGTQAGKLAVLGASAPDPLGQPDAASRVQNAQGLIESETDFQGSNSATRWDTARRLPLARTEAVGTPQQRTTATEWHSQWHLPTKITEAGRETTYTYDSQGNLLTQSVVGAASGTTRTWQWAYNSLGLVATRTAPNGAATSYQYDSAGDLTHRTNALGQTDAYTHDGAGRVLTHTAPNGAITTYTYDPRGRLLARQRGGLATAYTYRASGQLASATLASGYAISYQYDAAQRLTGWSDNRGASASYQLDAMGNRVQESIAQQGQDSTPTTRQTVWQLARAINSLNRVQSVTVGDSAAPQGYSYGYNANGDLTSATDGQGQTTRYGLDALRRVQSITDPADATATLQYDALDAITQASDFQGTATNYQRDALGNATTEASPDAGTAHTTYDSLGLPQQITDATGRTTTLTRDALGRTTAIEYADGTRTQLRHDLTGSTYYNAPGSPNASVGYLAEIKAPTVTTRYQRDALGRLTRKTQLLSSGDVRSVSYAYVPPGQGGAGQLARITYPSGRRLTYQYDGTGQLTALQWDGLLLLADLTWNPLGQPTGWRWPGIGPLGGLAETRQYDTAGQLTHTSLLDLTRDSAGRITQIQQQHLLPGTAQEPQQATITSAYTYDALGRLTASGHTTTATLPAGLGLADVAGYTSMGYSYDANGNRLADTQARQLASGTSLTTTRTYTIAPGTNRLTDVSATEDGTTAASIAYGYDATGAITSATRNGATHYLKYGAQGHVSQLIPGRASGPWAVRYTYNGIGQRILKTDARTGMADLRIEHTLYSDEDATQMLGSYRNKRSLDSAAPQGENDSTEVIYLPTASGLLPIATQINGRLYAIHADHLNTPRRLTNSQGQVAWQWLITGFGETNPTTGAGGYLQTGNGYTYSEAVTFDLRYPGQVWDEETQLSYNMSRYYDPATGRYIQADPIGLEGWNRFAYVEGNPLNYTDPKGLNPLTGAWAGAGAGSAFGPVGTVVGGIVGAGVGAWIGWNVVGPMWAKPPANAYDPNGPKAPGKPGEAEGFKDPKGGENWVPNPNPGKGGSGYGWQDANGDVWCPTGQGGNAHGGPHWDVQTPGGDYRNVKPRR
jgi:RHS repeat-associated protein